MPADSLNVLPTTEEVIALCQKLKARNATQRRDRGIVSFTLIIGMIMAVKGLFPMLAGSQPPGVWFISGASLLAGGIIGVVYLALPSDLMKIARRLQLSTDPNVIPPLLDALTLALIGLAILVAAVIMIAISKAGRG